MLQPVSAQCTMQLPVHFTRQVSTDVQVTSLFGPTCAEHAEVS
jgi:hypothetical protein